MSETETLDEMPAATWDAAMQASEMKAHEEAHPPRRYPEILPVKLTESEIADRGKKAAAARLRVAEIEAKKKEAADHWKAKLELAENERDEFLDVIATGSEDREVECIETFEFRAGLVTVVRADTGEKIRERAMTSSERQPSLPGTTLTQAQLDDAPQSHDGDEVDEPSEGDITDPEGVMADAVEEPAARVIRRKRKSP